MEGENEEPEEQFSDDPDEQLKIENELLKLKMQAEFGASFGGEQDLPPEIEQEFLKQVLAFQENHEHAPLVKLGDLLDEPESFRLSAELPESELPARWQKLEAMLADKGLLVTFQIDYPLVVKYDFVLNELFPLEIQQPQPGHNWIFPYEEFHPNHELDMERAVEQFMEDFFGNKIQERRYYLADPVITGSGQKLNFKEFSEKVTRFHDLFREVKDYKYDVLETRYNEPEKENDPLVGFLEGEVLYNVVTEDGSVQEIKGPFRFYFQHKGYWSVYFFSLHGFSWA